MTYYKILSCNSLYVLSENYNIIALDILSVMNFVFPLFLGN